MPGRALDRPNRFPADQPLTNTRACTPTSAIAPPPRAPRLRHRPSPVTPPSGPPISLADGRDHGVGDRRREIFHGPRLTDDGLLAIRLALGAAHAAGTLRGIAPSRPARPPVLPGAPPVEAEPDLIDPVGQAASAGAALEQAPARKRPARPSQLPNPRLTVSLSLLLLLTRRGSRTGLSACSASRRAWRARCSASRARAASGSSRSTSAGWLRSRRSGPRTAAMRSRSTGWSRSRRRCGRRSSRRCAPRRRRRPTRSGPPTTG